MLNTPDYLVISKRRAECAACGQSLVESDRHPSVLVEPGAAPAPPPVGEKPETGAAALPPEATPMPADDAASAPGVSATSAPAVPAAAGDAASGSAPADAAPASGDGVPVTFQRLDYCQECWQKMKDQAYFSFWIGRRNPTDIPLQKLNRHERNLALVALFDSMSERGNAETDYSPHLFFLAHLLMRYRIFKYRPSVTDPATGASTLRFSRTDGEEEVQVADVEMPPEEIVRVKEEVEAYLQQSTGQRIIL